MLNQTQVETLEFLQKGGLRLLEQQGMAMRFATKRIGNDICLARMIVNTHIIVLDQLFGWH